MKIETAIENLKYCKEQLTIERGSDFSGVEALELALNVLDLCTSKDQNYEVRHLKEDVECLPSISYSEKLNRSGEWIPNPPFMAKCSLCGYIQSTNGADLTGKALVHKAIYKYCPNCGAKMGAEE